MTKSTLEQYKTYVSNQLNQLFPLLQRYAQGDFSQPIPLPEQEDEFAGLFVELNRMVDNMREMAQEKEQTMATLQDTENDLRDYRDHFEERVAEKTRALQQSEERFRLLATHATDMMYRMRLSDGAYEYVSPVSETLFGYTPEEFYANPVLIQEVIHPDWTHYFEEEWTKLLRGEMVPFYEYQIVHKTGETRWMHQRNALMRDAQGHPIAIQGIVRDITDRKRMEEALRTARDDLETLVRERTAALRESEEKYRNVVERANDGIVIAQGAHLAFANQRFAAMAGYTLEELTGMEFLTLVPAEKRELIQDRVRRRLAGEDVPAVYEIELLKKDGTPFTVEVNAGVIHFQSAPADLVVLRDITDRKQAEKTLREALAFNATIIAEAPTGIAVYDHTGQCLEANASLGKAIGATREQMLQQNYQHIASWKKSGLYDKAIKALREHSTQHHNVEISSSFQKFVYLDCQLVPFGKNGLLLMAHDVSARVKAETALRENEQRLFQFLEAMPVGVFIVEPDGTPFYANTLAQELLGKGIVPEAIPQKLAETYKAYSAGTTQGYPMEKMPVVRALNGEVSTIDDMEIRRPDRAIPIQVWGSPVYDSQGKIVFATAAFGDISKQKAAEAALRESEEKYRSLFENMNEGFAFHEIIVNEDKSPIDYRYLDLNPAFERFTGLVREEVIGKTVREILPGTEDDPADWIGTFGHVALTGQRISFENFSEAIGQWFQVHAFSPQIGRFAVTFTDITERKHAEQERERLNLELSQKNQELEQIVYVTSHDLRAPLVNVQGFSQELKYELEDLREMLERRNIPQDLRQQILGVMDEAILEDLSFILTSVAKMDTLLSGLLKLSRLGRAALRIESLDMNRLIAQVSAVFEFQIKEAGATVEMASLPPCRGDADQINQVFSNLLGNALKYLNSERPGRINIRGYQEDGQSVYCLEDNGIGIAVEHQHKIFEIFHRLNPDESPGEGLGLTIIRKILERHHGKIWVESEPGHGSTFYVSMPAGKHAL